MLVKNYLIPKYKNLFPEKHNKIINIIQTAKLKCIEIFKEELKNLDEVLKTTYKDV